MARRRQSSTVPRSVVLVLCATLFAWGMSGKLSGYKAPNQSHPKSVVKLIQDDQTRRLAVSAPVAPRSPFLDSADLAALSSPPRLIVGRIHHIHKTASASSYTYALYHRPPPSTI
jgi:hypothetical protein